MAEPPNYFDPGLPAGLRIVGMPVVDASAETLRGYRQLVHHPAQCKVEIVRVRRSRGGADPAPMTVRALGMRPASAPA